MKVFATFLLTILIQTYGLGLETTNPFDTKSKYDAYDKMAKSVMNSGIRKVLKMGRAEYEFNKKLWSPIELNSDEDEFLKEQKKSFNEESTAPKKPQPDTSSRFEPVDIKPIDVTKDNGPDKTTIRQKFGSFNDLSWSTVHESSIEHQKREMQNMINYAPVSSDPYYKLELNLPNL